MKDDETDYGCFLVIGGLILALFWVVVILHFIIKYW
jgi:hypothetical protein